METHLTLLALYMGIERTPAVEHANHSLIEQMLSRMGWRKLLLIVLVEYKIGHIDKFLGTKIQKKIKINKKCATFRLQVASNS